ncbi:hypothetical protein GCM10010260_67650 [Streptomyces filipinensis]|uniref:Lipoprotein n=1 Tax=Streptomyces filipinensis TaxID=66887 RepID=A0A918IIM8_9ACTN|nr:hypothetical protein [Streptomyces filipinensis]GGV18324.1 hypothetical protein GCM10010260_67650 [Streptomyces filipinensis]
MMRTRFAGAGQRSVAGLLTAVSGFALLSACGLPDHRVDDAKHGATASAGPSFVPKAPVPSGKALGPDAHVAHPGNVNGTDASVVAKAWAELAYSYDTKYDTSPHDAVLRASRWFTERKAADERQYQPASGPGVEWNTWAKHHAWTTVTVSSELEDDAPRDSKTVAYRSLVVRGTAHGRDGWTGTGPRLNAYVKLVRSVAGAPWRVDDVMVVVAATPPSADTSPASAGSSSDSSAQ